MGAGGSIGYASVEEALAAGLTQEQVDEYLKELNAPVDEATGEVGMRVELHSLNAQQFNGRAGTLKEWDAAQSRWMVVLDAVDDQGGELQSLLLKPTNLKKRQPPPPPQPVKKSNNDGTPEKAANTTTTGSATTTTTTTTATTDEGTTNISATTTTTTSEIETKKAVSPKKDDRPNTDAAPGPETKDDDTKAATTTTKYAPVLRTPSAKVLQRHTSDQLAEMKDTFDSIDGDKSGRIHVEELARHMAEHTQDLTVDDLKELCDEHNKDGSGELAFHHFVSMMGPILYPHLQRAESQIDAGELDEADQNDFFAMVDVDGDGNVTKDELRTAWENMGEKMSEEDLEEMMRQADTDHDGKINAKEFAKMFCN